MDARRRDGLLAAALAASCYALALLQRPGTPFADTKIDLHVDPVSFLSDVASVWSPTTSFGHVQSGQYGGYLFPMGPFYALAHDLGLGAWLTQRLWLGTLYALAAWGVVRLLDALLGRPCGVAHVVAAAAYVLNPYVLAYTSRASVTLLALAALPWLLLAVHCGLRTPRGWVWPAAAALVTTAAGGGVNAAVIAYVLVGPVLLALYEPALGMVAWRDARAFAWRTLVVGFVCSLWWIVPLAIQARYGLAFLPFTEQSGTIWDTTSLSESLRLMGFWLSYIGVGYGGHLRPYTADAPVLLFQPAVLAATLLVPALALGGFAWTRRWRHGPFFLGMTLLGAIVMSAGFPPGSPLRRALTFAYEHVALVQFLRTTYKAGPLVALGLAVLGGVAAGLLWRRLGRAPAWGRPALAVAVAGLLVLASWPLWRGRAVDSQLTFHVPAAWRDAGRDLDVHLGDDARAMVLPGQLFASYRWGGTYDAILPALTRKPVAVRAIVPYADLRSVDLQWTTDALVSQLRALPGQLAPLLRLEGVGAVVTGSDDDRSRSGAASAADAARVLADQRGLGRAQRTFGPLRRIAPGAGSLAPPLALPEVRRSSLRGDGLVRVLPHDGGLVVDGSADGLAELASFGALPERAPLRYAADLTPAALRAAVRAGAGVVISDSNRRRVFAASRPRGSFGPTLTASDPFPPDGAELDPWPQRGTAAQTVAAIDGILAVRAPSSPQVTQFPEHRPFAALDGDPSTAWLADRHLDFDRWWLEVALLRPRDVPWIDLLPYGDERGRVTAVRVNGRELGVRPGWNRLRVGLRHVRVVRVQFAHLTRPRRGVPGGAGGIRELRIPGVRARESLRPPVLAERALAGVDLRGVPLAYAFARTTGEDPFHRSAAFGPWQAGLVRDQDDAEHGLDRLLAPPLAARWRATAWVSVAPGAPDDLLDGLAGTTGGARVTSSSRYEGVPARRASRAFDGDRRTAWIGTWLPGRPAWIAWTLSRPATVRALTLVAPAVAVRRPVLVRVLADGRPGPALAVGPGGRVALPAAVHGRAFRLEILAARFPAGTTGFERQRRAVGIAEVRGAGVAAPLRGGGQVRAGCALRGVVDGRVLALRPVGDVRDLDAGRPLRARECGAPIALPAGSQRLVFPPDAPFRVDDLLLSTGPAVARAAAGEGGVVLRSGSAGRASRSATRVRIDGPSWLVLGESYSRGWRASCDGRDLGAPRPLEGFANGWPVDRGCRDVAFSFAPQRLADVGYLVSAIVCLALLALLAAWRLRRLRRSRLRAPERDERPPAPLPERIVAAWPLRRALVAAVAAGLVGAALFALRAGIVIAPVVLVVLVRAIDARRLALAAGGLLAVVVPVLYLALPVHDRGGYNPALPVERVATHWVAVAAVVLLLLALARSLPLAALSRARGRGAGARR